MSQATAHTQQTPTRRMRLIGFVLTSALASTALSGCGGKVAPSAAVSSEAARVALAKGKGAKAVTAAEAAVLASPRDPAVRALLGAAYVEAGRFGSAATALADAMALGDATPRTVLTRALALAAAARYAEAQTLLGEHQATLDAADFGLAITLAGSPQQGIEALSNALRYGENTPKLRQNLAYAFALRGDWRSARLLAAQDVAADRLAERLGEWAQMAAPNMAPQRVAALLGVTVREDAGQPLHLALDRFPTNDQLAAEAATQDAALPASAPETVVAAARDGELPPVPATTDGALASAAQIAPADTFAMAYGDSAAPAAVSSTPAAPRIVLPALTPAPMRAKAVASRPAPSPRAAPFVHQPGSYRVQLGSYASMAGASEAWTRFQKRHPELKGAERIVARANVGGKTYYRVAAGGFAKGSANSFCARVKQTGGGCLAYAGGRTLPGTVARQTRVAAR